MLQINVMLEKWNVIQNVCYVSALIHSFVRVCYSILKKFFDLRHVIEEVSPSLTNKT